MHQESLHKHSIRNERGNSQLLEPDCFVAIFTMKSPILFCVLGTLIVLVTLNVYNTVSLIPTATTTSLSRESFTSYMTSRDSFPADDTPNNEKNEKEELVLSSPDNETTTTREQPTTTVDIGRLKHHGLNHRVAGLSCPAFPTLRNYEQVQEEITYWRDISGDSLTTSPYQCSSPQQQNNKKYLTFEPDEGGWNNIRIALETVVAMAVVMGRVLVLPPSQEFVRMSTHLGYDDFYHLASIQSELASLEVITFQDFLERHVVTGHVLADPITGTPMQPPEGRTDWNGLLKNHESAKYGHGSTLWNWWRKVATPLLWDYDQCIAVFPEPSHSDCDGTGWRYTTKEDEDRVQRYVMQIKAEDAARMKPNNKRPAWAVRVDTYNNNPTPIDASPAQRMAEVLAHRSNLCIYDRTLQDAPVLHAMGEQIGTRFLVHFYAFLFIEDWRFSVWLNRFVRDHLRYVDEIQCAAARVVAKLHEYAHDTQDNPTGSFDTMHVRRGDFISFYKQTVQSGEQLYDNHVKQVIAENRTIYIATDEQDKKYFETLSKHNKLYYLEDFKDLLNDLDPNYYGMLDQLIASTGDIFIGTFYSTFSGFINRLRGYRSQKAQLPGYELGKIQSYYTYGDQGLRGARDMMLNYRSVRQSFWTNEFPVGWRDLDYGLHEQSVKR